MTIATTMTNEQDVRLRLLNTLLTTPHRKLAEIWPVHSDMVKSDPRFYVRLAAWYADHGDVRDHKEMFAITLALIAFAGHRDVGLALLREMPPYEVLRVVDFIHGRKTTRKVIERVQPNRQQSRAERKQARRAAQAQAVAQARVQRGRRRGRRGLVDRVIGAVTGRRAPQVPAATQTPTPQVPQNQRTATSQTRVRVVTESFSLFRQPPRSLRTEIERYLREREADSTWFDSSVLTARKAIKRLYALNHVKPSDRAQRILFDCDPPADSRIFALRVLAKATSPSEQARAIVENAIPYRVAATVVRQMTPTVLLALVDRMSPQEVINNIASLTKRGAMDNGELKGLIEQKLEQAKTSGRVSAFKTGQALKAAPVSDEVKAKLEQVADTQVKAKGRIQRPTALLIDKSGSMGLAIELGKRIGAMISAVCEKELFVYAFDTIAYPIDRPRDAGDDLASWERALVGITAGGGTSIGCSIEAMRLKQQYVEQIILVTDEGENTGPLFVPTLEKYRKLTGAEPSVCIVRTPGGTPHLENQCRAAGVMCDVFAFGGDYYALSNLVPLLTRPSKLQLLMEIMEYPLPVRKSA